MILKTSPVQSTVFKPAVVVVVVAGLALLALIGLRYALAEPVLADPIVHNDSSGWTNAVDLERIGHGRRLPTLRVFFSSFASLSHAAIAQTLIAATLWWAAAVLLAAATSGVMRWAVGGFVLFLALQPAVTLWDVSILSESLSLAFLAVSLGAAALFLRRPSWRTAALLASLLFIFGTLRHSSAPHALMIGLSTAVVALTRARAPALAVVGAAVLAFMLSVGHVLYTDGDDFAVFNNVQARVLPYPQRVEAFVEKGMPYNDAVASRAGVLGRSGGADPALQEWTDWVRAQGSSAYWRLLARDPVEWAPLVFMRPEFSHAPDYWLYVRLGRTEDGATAARPLTAYAQMLAPFGMGLAIALGLALLVGFSTWRQWLGAVALAISGGVCVVFFYLADAMEPGRHILPGLIHLQIAIAVAAAMAASKTPAKPGDKAGESGHE